MDKKKANARVVAHYLPQFHPIPENDTWWGKGFTEWTNLAKAKPLFPGHHQPNLPADLGFYDLRVPETRESQAELARDHGIEGFCYWHYWFAGKRLLERPFNEVVNSGKPDLPFCLAWANQTWTGIWHGAPNRILIEQTYPGLEDYKSHFYAVLDSFQDDRYIKVNGKPLFVVYSPIGLPDQRAFTDCWRELAAKSGLKGLYLVGHVANLSWVPAENGFDAAIIDILTRIRKKMDWLKDKDAGPIKKAYKRKIQRRIKPIIERYRALKPTVYQYRDVIEVAIPKTPPDFDYFPSVIPNWDNTPRSGKNGLVFHNSTPALFRDHFKEALTQVGDREPEKQIIFVKSWNEWAEGNYLEPDTRFGSANLQVIKEALSNKQMYS